MSSIWDIKPKKQPANKAKKPQNELTEEIKAFRDNQKAFNATNETETYLVLCFSTNEDKKKFVQNVLNKNNATFVDGYMFARSIGKLPDKPSLKLPKPLNE